MTDARAAARLLGGGGVTSRGHRRAPILGCVVLARFALYREVLSALPRLEAVV